MKSILDSTFRYTNSANTDLRKTFARVRREQRRRADAQETVHPAGKIVPMRRGMVAITPEGKSSTGSKPG